MHPFMEGLVDLMKSLSDPNIDENSYLGKISPIDNMCLSPHLRQLALIWPTNTSIGEKMINKINAKYNLKTFNDGKYAQDIGGRARQKQKQMTTLVKDK